MGCSAPPGCFAGRLRGTLLQESRETKPEGTHGRQERQRDGGDAAAGGGCDSRGGCGPAPQSGRATRRDIARYARKTTRKLEGAAGEIAESVADMADAVEEKAEELLEKGKDLSRETREAVLTALNEGQERLGRQRDRLAKLLA
ncbi:MAG: hypothetical protein B7Z62_03050 [Deltaproteobacteria bacterium 37-65-8]|nr:MAG: hypothetical protein B7Z62_03050 [Deltaproteobacteria bacterium 37-65-8]